MPGIFCSKQETSACSRIRSTKKIFFMNLIRFVNLWKSPISYIDRGSDTGEWASQKMAVITGDKIWISKWASGNVTSLAACVIFVISASAHQTQISEPVKTKKPPPSRCLTPTILGGLISEPEPELRGEGGGALANMCLLHTLITSGVNTLLMWWPHEPHPLQSLLVIEPQAQNFHQTLRPGKTLP